MIPKLWQINMIHQQALTKCSPKNDAATENGLCRARNNWSTLYKKCEKFWKKIQSKSINVAHLIHETSWKKQPKKRCGDPKWPLPTIIDTVQKNMKNFGKKCKVNQSPLLTKSMKHPQKWSPGTKCSPKNDAVTKNGLYRARNKLIDTAEKM